MAPLNPSESKLVVKGAASSVRAEFAKRGGGLAAVLSGGWEGKTPVLSAFLAASPAEMRSERDPDYFRAKGAEIKERVKAGYLGEIQRAAA
jgi:hypothetical protein